MDFRHSKAVQFSKSSVFRPIFPKCVKNPNKKVWISDNLGFQTSRFQKLTVFKNHFLLTNAINIFQEEKYRLGKQSLVNVSRKMPIVYFPRSQILWYPKSHRILDWVPLEIGIGMKSSCLRLILNFNCEKIYVHVLCICKITPKIDLAI